MQRSSISRYPIICAIAHLSLFDIWQPASKCFLGDSKRFLGGFKRFLGGLGVFDAVRHLLGGFKRFQTITLNTAKKSGLSTVKRESYCTYYVIERDKAVQELL